MLIVTCIEKIRVNNKICGYQLQDEDGCTEGYSANDLKNSIRNKSVVVTNLKLTSDNKLVDRVEKIQKYSSEQIQNLIIKAKVLGIYKEIPVVDEGYCLLISKSETDHVVYIPDNVIALNYFGDDFNYAPVKDLNFTHHIWKLKGSIRVVGGNNLVDAHYMFRGCLAQYIDLSELYTKKIINVQDMFSYCHAKLKATDERILEQHRYRSK